MYNTGWESLKTKAIYEFNTKMNKDHISKDSPWFMALIGMMSGSKPQLADKTIEEWRVYGERLIGDWDVRCVKKLVDCFPAIVPKYYHDKTVRAEYNERGNWVVTFGPEAHNDL